MTSRWLVAFAVAASFGTCTQFAGAAFCNYTHGIVPIKIYNVGTECEQVTYDLDEDSTFTLYAGYTIDATILNLDTDDTALTDFVCPLNSHWDDKQLLDGGEFCPAEEVAIYVINNKTGDADAIECKLIVNEPYNLALTNIGTKATTANGVNKLTWTGPQDPSPKDFWFITCSIPGRSGAAGPADPSGIHSYYSTQWDTFDLE